MGADPSKTSNNFSTSQVEGEDTREGVNTTGFNNDANIVSATVNNYIKINSVINKSSADTTEQSVKQFLGKPNLLVSGVLSSTDTVSTFPTYQAPQSALSKAIYANKIMGFLGFRATLVLRLQINANKFQQGRYMLTFTHSGGSNPTSTAGALNYLAHTNTLTARTQLPHVELDLACDTEAILKIPYTSCMNYTPISAITAQNGFGSVGSFQIFPYSPLVAPTGSTTCSYSLWTSFEDVELITAAAPQSGRMMTGTSISEKEAPVKGPISTTLIKISKAASLFVPVPGISSYASGLSWVSELAGKSAAIFGWSKPVNHAHVQRMQRQALANFSNVNTPDQGQMLSFRADNAVDVLPGFSSTDTDEMDFSYITSIPAWISTTAWTTSQASGTAIYEIGVSPLAGFTTRSLLGSVSVSDYTPIGFVADYFNLWRGSIIFTFKLVKTEFHSGRLAVVFFPHEDYVGISTRSLDLSAYAHREVIDVREASTFTVAIPFCSSSPYRPIRGQGFSIGTLSVYVLDPLVAPASVSTSVNMLVEISAGPDMEFAIPRSWANNPVMNATPQSGSMMTAPMPEKQECVQFNGTIGNATIESDGGVNAAACIGEKISSFRTLIKAMNILNYLPTEPTPLKYFHTLPYASTVYYNSLTNPYPATVGDLYSALSGIYAMVRGGVRLKYITDASTASGFAPVVHATQYDASNGNLIYSTFYSASTVNATANNNALRISAPQNFENIQANFGAEATIPQYHRYHSRATADHYSNTNVPYSVSNGTLSNRTIVTLTYPKVATLPVIYLARGGADDSNFGVFVSIPPMQSALGSAGTL